MGTKVESTTDVVTLRLSGYYIGDKETDELRNIFRRLVRDGNTKLILDLGGVRKVNSMALSLLLQIHKDYVSRGGRVILANPENLDNVLTVTRLAEVFEFGPSLSEALAKLGV